MHFLASLSHYEVIKYSDIVLAFLMHSFIERTEWPAQSTWTSYTRRQLLVAMKGKLWGRSICTCITMQSSPAVFDNIFVSWKWCWSSAAYTCESFAFAQMRKIKAERWVKFDTHWCVLSYFAVVNNKVMLRIPQLKLTRVKMWPFFFSAALLFVCTLPSLPKKVVREYIY